MPIGTSIAEDSLSVRLGFSSPVPKDQWSDKELGEDLNSEDDLYLRMKGNSIRDHLMPELESSQRLRMA